MEWDSRILEQENDTFQLMYSMEYNAFLKIWTILSPQVQFNDEMSGQKNFNGIYNYEIIYYCILWWLGSGRYLHMRTSADFSPATCYSCI